MARIGRALGLVTLLVTQACWLQVGGGEQRTGFTGLESEVTSETVADLDVAWTASIGASAREALVSGARAYVPSAGAVTALDVRDGTTRWSTSGLGATAAPAIAGDRLLVPAGGTHCGISALDLGTGAAVDVQAFGPPDVSGSGGFSQCSSGDVVASGGTAMMTWHYVGSSPSPGCVPNAVYQVGPGIVALDVDDLSPRWGHQETDTGCGAPPTITPPYGASSAEGPDAALVATGQGVRTFGCTTTGCPAPWSHHAGAEVVGPPVVVPGGDIAVALVDGRVLVLDGTSHALEWTGQVGATVAQALATDGTSIFAVSDTGDVAAFSTQGCGAATCSASWTATPAGPASVRPSIGADVLYVGSADGTVSAFDTTGCGAATCPPLWTGTTPADVTGAPAISGGRVIVGSANGAVTAFALPDAEP